MKLFGYEINIGKPQNIDKATPEKAKPYHSFVSYKQQIYRTSADVGKFKSAVISAENLQNPQRYSLYQIYRNVVLDAHLSAVWFQRVNLSLQKKWYVKNADGEVNEELTKLIDAPWFRKFIELSLESELWGHSLIQFGDIKDNKFTSLELVPRHHVKPEYGIVVQYWSDLHGKSYYDEPFSDWVLPVGDNYNLGLLLKASPLVIWKQGSLGSWAEYQEVFGVPFRYIKTNTLDEQTKNNAIQMAEEMGSSSYAVIDQSDEMEILEANKTDAHRVFDEMVNRINQELSKLILGQTGTSDEKSFSGSAEVHERVLKMVEEADEHFLEGVLNYQLLPFMRNLGLPYPEGVYICASEKEAMNIQDKGKLLVELIKTGKYYAEPEYLKQTFGIELDEIESTEDDVIQNVQNKLKTYYK